MYFVFQASLITGSALKTYLTMPELTMSCKSELETFMTLILSREPDQQDLVTQFIDLFSVVDSETTDSDKSNEMKKEVGLTQPQLLKFDVIILIRTYFSQIEDSSDEFYEVCIGFVEKELIKIDFKSMNLCLQATNALMNSAPN
jgi:hypothetical protein